jgi:hypothetical protein
MLTFEQKQTAQNLKLSENFSLYELISSSHENLVEYPSDDIISKLKMHAEDILQPIRDHFGRIRVSSGYRNPNLNKRVGGVSNSIHQIYHNGAYLGTATDIQPMDERDLVKVMRWIKENVPAVKRIIIYRDLDKLGINSPFLHIDRDVKVAAGDIILMEKTGPGKYEFFDESEFENY